MAHGISAVENTDLRSWWAKTYAVEAVVFGIVTNDGVILLITEHACSRWVKILLQMEHEEARVEHCCAFEFWEIARQKELALRSYWWRDARQYWWLHEVSLLSGNTAEITKVAEVSARARLVARWVERRILLIDLTMIVDSQFDKSEMWTKRVLVYFRR